MGATCVLSASIQSTALWLRCCCAMANFQATMTAVFEGLHGGNPNVRFGPENRTLLGAAIMDGNSAEVAKLLKHPNIDVNVQGTDGGSPLIIAAAKGHLGIVEMLLHAKAQPWLKDKRGWTALHYASMEPCHLGIITALAACPTTDIDQEGSFRGRDTGGGTALFMATVEGQVDAVRTLLSLGARQDIRCMGKLPREAAIEKGCQRASRAWGSSRRRLSSWRPPWAGGRRRLHWPSASSRR